MAFFVRHGELSHPIKTSKRGAIRKLEHGCVNQTGIEMKHTCIFIYIYINSNGSLFKPGFVLGEDVCKIMYVTVHVTNHVTLAVLELAVLGSCLLFSSCHFQMTLSDETYR